MADTNRGIWTCKIGEVDRAKLPSGSDNYMRDALVDVYESLVGERPTFIFSGWGGELTEPERAVVEDREPAPPMADTLEELEGWEGEVLRMIAATLTAIGCRHEGGQESTPPMMYDDWIKCAVGKREDELRALRESHDAAIEALREQGFVVRAGAAYEWHADNCHGFDTDCGNRRCELGRAALAKAEALHG